MAKPRIMFTAKGEERLYGTARSSAPKDISAALASAHAYLRRSYNGHQDKDQILGSIRIEYPKTGDFADCSAGEPPCNCGVEEHGLAYHTHACPAYQAGHRTPCEPKLAQHGEP